MCLHTFTMNTISLLLLSLLQSLVDSQTAPYVSFRGETLPNHGYVDLGLVEDSETGGDGVQCHTDIQACCSTSEGGIRSGEWFFPDGMRVPFSNDEDADIYMLRTVQRLELRRREDSLSPSGIYRCRIAVNDDDESRVVETVYVGIYGSGGIILLQTAYNNYYSM